jgi:hypothetical protein
VKIHIVEKNMTVLMEQEDFAHHFVRIDLFLEQDFSEQ